METASDLGRNYAETVPQGRGNQSPGSHELRLCVGRTDGFFGTVKGNT